MVGILVHGVDQLIVCVPLPIETLPVAEEIRRGGLCQLPTVSDQLPHIRQCCGCCCGELEENQGLRPS
jgi:hypothetical protein